MKNSSKNSGIRVKSAVKAGGMGGSNHNSGIRVKSAVKAGGFGGSNHNAGVRVKSSVRPESSWPARIQSSACR